MKAYLNVQDCGQGIFSRERILETRDYSGNLLSGFFDKSNIKDGKLEVTVIEADDKGIVVCTPQLFFQRTSLVYFKISDLTYEQV